MTYIFDLDGTMVDSMPTSCNKLIEMLKAENVDYPDDIIKIITPLGYLGAIEYIIGLGVKQSKEEMLSSMLEYNLNEYRFNIPAKPFVIEKLLSLKKEGHCLNVLTASPHILLVDCLKRLGLFDLFDNVWSVEDFSFTKDEPEIYKWVAKFLKKKVTDCTMVDDNIEVIKAVKKAGMIAVGVYDEMSSDLVDEMKAAADRYIYDFSEL